MWVWILFFGLILSSGEAQNEDLWLSHFQKQSGEIDSLKIRVIKLEKEKALLAKKIKQMELHHKSQLEKVYKEMEKRLGNLEEKTESFIHVFSYLGSNRYSAGGKSYLVKEYKHNLTGIDFVLIPGGSFLMGSNDENKRGSELAA